MPRFWTSENSGSIRRPALDGTVDGNLTNTTVNQNNGFAQYVFNQEYDRAMWRDSDPDSMNFGARNGSSAYAYLTEVELRYPVKEHVEEAKESVLRCTGCYELSSLEASSKSVWKRNARVTFRMHYAIGLLPEQIRSWSTRHDLGIERGHHFRYIQG